MSDEKIPRPRQLLTKASEFHVNQSKIKAIKHFHTIVKYNEMKIRRRGDETDQRE
jgi:hypothetical protein